MGKKPTGAMGATHSVPGYADARGNPPRYGHLPRSEAWAKIDEENKLRADKIVEAEVNAKVQAKLAELNKVESPVVAIQSDDATPEVETPTVKFTSSELTSVLVALQPISDITDTNLSVINVTIAGVKVEIHKA